MIRNFEIFPTQANTLHWEIFPSETNICLHVAFYFPLENTLQANNTFVLFICSLYKTLYFFVQIYYTALFAFVEYSAKNRLIWGVFFIPLNRARKIPLVAGVRYSPLRAQVRESENFYYKKIYTFPINSKNIDSENFFLQNLSPSH